ncbi:MAG TPA: stage II sporulation protein M [Bacteroidia bacterium]
MRESKFVEQNKEKWEKIEKDLLNKVSDPHVLRTHLIHITDDLSYARTFYKNRSVRVYLNGIAQSVYNRIYKSKFNFFKSVKKFYIDDVPSIMYHSRKELFFSFLVLILAFTIGFFSSVKDPEFVNTILSDGYVKMTKDNIESGDPMGVYKETQPFQMFVMIASNNIAVSFYLFIFGLIAGYGTLVMLLFNGIMLGTFYHFFYSRGLTADFNYTVWMHGAIEISCMVIVGVAGMLLGKGLINPGSFSRMKAFNIWGRRGSMILLSLIPFIILAAFIESYLTRHTEVSNLLRGIFIVLSLILMFGYFAFYPYLRFRKSGDAQLGMPELNADKDIEFQKGVIYSRSQIFLKSIQLFIGNFPSIIRLALLVSSVLTVLFYFIYIEYSDTTIHVGGLNLFNLLEDSIDGSNQFFGQLYINLALVFNKLERFDIYIITTIWLIVLLGYSYGRFNLKINGTFKFDTKKIVTLSIGVLLFNALFLIDIPAMGLLAILLSGTLILIFSNTLNKDEKNERGILSILGTGFIKSLSTTLLFLFVLTLGMIIVASPLLFYLLSFIEVNFKLDNETYNSMTMILMMFFTCMVVTLSLVFYVFENSFLYYSIGEISSASGISEKIDSIGKTKKAYGIETE